MCAHILRLRLSVHNKICYLYIVREIDRLEMKTDARGLGILSETEKVPKREVYIMSQRQEYVGSGPHSTSLTINSYQDVRVCR